MCDELKDVIQKILTPNFIDIPESAVEILKEPIFQKHLKKLRRDFEGEQNITDALRMFLPNEDLRNSTIKIPTYMGRTISPQNPQSYYFIFKKNYEMIWSSSHWQSDNQLRLD